MQILDIYIFVVGLCNGSFFNCLSDCYIEHSPMIHSRSQCDKCGHVLSLSDLIPLVSWIVLKGRCRYCGNRISFKYPLTELVCGVGHLLIFKRFGLEYFTIIYIIVFLMFFIISLVDIKTYEIPQNCLLVIVISWIILNVLENHLNNIVYAVIISFYVYLISLIMKKIAGKECFGFGDIELIFVICLFLGIYKTVWCLLIACVSGFVLIVISKKEMIPFGPSLSLAFIFLLLYGDKLII